MNPTRANSAGWEWVEPSRIVAVHDLVTDAHRALESRAASSWGAERRRAMADTLDRVRAQMRELECLAGYEHGGDDARTAELRHRRLELPPGARILDRPPDLPDVREQSR